MELLHKQEKERQMAEQNETVIQKMEQTENTYTIQIDQLRNQL